MFCSHARTALLGVLLSCACDGSPSAATDAGPPPEDAGDTDTGSETDSDDTDPADGGLLQVEAVVDGPFAVGEFIVQIDDGADDGCAGLTIAHASEPERELWAALPCESFVMAAIAEATITEQRGSFDIQDEILAACGAQTIEAIAPQPDGALLVGGQLSGTDCATAYTLELIPHADHQLELQVRLPDAPPEVNRVYLRHASSAGERFFGFGEQFCHLDMKGRSVPVYTQEQGIGRGAEPATSIIELVSPGSGGSWFSTYAASPHYITSELRSLYLVDPEVSWFDLESPDRVVVKLFAPRMTARVVHGQSPLDLIEEHTSWTGRMPPLPDWLGRGAVLGLQGGSDAVRDKLAPFAERGTPVAALWLQDWVGQRTTIAGQQLWWNWELNEAHYPGWDDLVDELANDDIRVLTYWSPFLTDVAGQDGFTRNLFAEALLAGYLVEDGFGLPYLVENTDFSAGLVDLTNPDARSWYAAVAADELLAAGASGWMADFGEALPFDGALHSGEDAAAAHNLYPEWWAELNREVIATAGLEGEALFFTRSGYSRSPGSSTLFWHGDQLVTFDEHDGLRSAITALLSSGMSGFSLNHGDIGGYTAINALLYTLYRSEELLLRWIELAAFTPVFRTHEGNRPGDNAQVYSSGTAADHLDRFARVYAALAPYRQGLMQEAAATGAPLCRHPFLHHPDDPEVLDLRYEWLLGPDLLVAPVTEAGATSVSVYLPAGRWIHLWSDAVYGDESSGSWHEIPAPIGEPPVFYREGRSVGLALVKALAEIEATAD